MSVKIIPVIHYADDEQTLRNARIAFDAGCDGVFLIHMEGRDHLLPPVATAIKKRWNDRLVGVNFLRMDADEAVVESIRHGLDMTWTDEQVTHSAEQPWAEASRIRDSRASFPRHLVFVGVAFKHQRAEPHPDQAALRACEMGLVPTTSGPATGVAADAGRIEELRRAIGPDAPLAIASGVTPENVHEFAPHLTHILVATGVSRSFHEFDADRLRMLVDVCAGGANSDDAAR